MATNAPDGSYQRPASQFRSTIEKGGQFPPERDRYHLYVSYSCPWATRTLIVRKLKGLEDTISFTPVVPRLGQQGWPFYNEADEYTTHPGAEPDPLYGSSHVKDLYFRAQSDYNGRFSVPVLWDKKKHTIVNNESSEIIRIFNTAFNELLAPEFAAVDLYPSELRSKIDELNEWIYPQINNGVYRAGFATSQEAYEKAVLGLFDGWDKVEKILSTKEYLSGDRLTEADVRLWVTAIRFDPAYCGHFKCNIRSIRHGYPAINKWLKKLYWTNDAFKSSTRFDHIKTGYYSQNNPSGIVPLGPIPDIEPL